MTKLGSYQLIRPLGRGGFGQTYLAEHCLLGTQACLKWAIDKGARPSLRREAQVLWELHHASLAGVRDLWEDRKLGPIVATRFVPGPSMNAYSPADAHQVLWVLGRLLRALRVLHHRGFVHNDIKPANIILENGHNPVLVDFGVASRGGRADGWTPLYVAPEVAGGQTPTPSSDLYSLGLTFLEWIGADLIQRQLPPAPPPMLKLLLGMCRRQPELRRDPLSEINNLLKVRPSA